MSLDAIDKALQIALACMAILGIKEWHREFLGRRRIELSEATLALIYQARDVIRFMRSPLVVSAETERVVQEPDEENSVFRARCSVGAIAFRYQKHSEIFSALNAMKYQYMARFGSEKLKLFEDMDSVVQSIFNAADVYVMLVREWPKRPDFSDAEAMAAWRGNREQRKEYAAIFQRRGRDDVLAKKVDAIVKEIETQAEHDTNKSALGRKLREHVVATFKYLNKRSRRA